MAEERMAEGSASNPMSDYDFASDSEELDITEVCSWKSNLQNFQI